MTDRERVLTALEMACFAAISVGVALAGYAAGGSLIGLATGLVTSGASGVYLVNAYSLPSTAEEQPDD